MEQTFFKEYHWKLKHLYDKFYTERATAIAAERSQASIVFYDSMYNEVQSIHRQGILWLHNELVSSGNLRIRLKSITSCSIR